METEAREVCEKLDDTLLKLMKSLKEISALRNRYRDVVREVGFIWNLKTFLQPFFPQLYRDT